jgi:hypothetical protein
VLLVGHSACRKVRYSMLEPDAGKLARPVLGGGGAGNSTSLPDPQTVAVDAPNNLHSGAFP